MVILVISRVFFCSKKFILPVRFTKISKSDKYTKTSNIDPLRTAKMTKMYHECLKYPKVLENDQKCP